MQLLPLILIAILMAVDGGLSPLGAQWQMSSAAITSLAWGPVLLIVLIATLGVSRCERQIVRGNMSRPLHVADKIVRWAGVLIVINHAAAVLIFGWLGMVRSLTGDLIFVDEFMALLPALIGLAGTWWAYYPIERHMREAVLIRQLDEGLPVYPTLTRMRFVWLQLRLHLLLMLVPLLIIVTLGELIQVMVERFGTRWPGWFGGAATFAAAAGVFVLSPLLARVLLDVKPLPNGSTRAMLQEICTAHRVRVRDLLLWNTNGTLINAAVMGLIGPLRYVLMTDALLESLRQDQVRAVMAHEIAHVRRHHMPWMVIALLACILFAFALVQGPAIALDALGWWPAEGTSGGDDFLQMTLSAAHLFLGLTIFGWVSRRFERQADTFAVQHLSACEAAQRDITTENTESTEKKLVNDTAKPIPAVITPTAVNAMCGALQMIARLNSIDPDRPSWRHGSILWRRRYLQSLIGRRIDRLRIDWIVRALKIISLTIVLAAVAVEWWLEAAS